MRASVMDDPIKVTKDQREAIVHRLKNYYINFVKIYCMKIHVSLEGSGEFPLCCNFV